MDDKNMATQNQNNLQPDPELPVADEDLSAPKLAAARSYVVGIGASAGGLEALSALISRLPVDLGASYVVVQHMSPTHRSMLVQLLARETAMPVSDMTDGASPEPNHIYVTPPNRNVVLQENCFSLSEPAAESIPKPSVNVFLTSLAEDRGEDAIAVILSGTGSDGAIGVRAVKAAGGLVFAQDTSTAKYSGMPQSAIDTECVDWIMSPEDIAAEIEVIARAHGSIPLRSVGQAPASLRTLLQRVMRHARVDFSGYKESTVWRRILRRMVSNRVHTLEDYLALTEKNPEELNQLCKEILISVTSFFRDSKAFEELRSALRECLGQKLPGDEVRIWVAGCATGEEAYSVAILVAELLGERIYEYRVQIFATDIDLNAMAVARRGVYPEAGLSVLDVGLLERYFQRRDGAYEVKKPIRDMVVFARQDLVQDPPFLRLDLITCRNVLIYFQGHLQEQVLTTFQYALRPHGLLFLGKSETTHQRENGFEAVSREAKVFRRRAGDASRLPTQMMGGGVLVNSEQKSTVTRTRKDSGEEDLLRAVVGSCLPAGVVITPQLDIRHVFGEVSSYLSIPAGRPDYNLLNLVRPEWRIEVQTLIYQALQRRQPILSRLHGGKEGVRLVVRPLGVRLFGNEEGLFVAFETISSATPGLPTDGQVQITDASQSLEEELTATREHLQTVIEELETSNEETQALNEELQASNEELQASNEELQASNEELQSTNEELTTVNEELQIKTAELADTNADLENIQNSMGFLILVVNDQLRLVRYNLAAAQWLGLTVGAIGENLRALPNIHNYPDLIEAVLQVLRERHPMELPIAYESRHFRLRVMPRIMSSRESMGAVNTLNEETELVDAQRRLRQSEQRLLAIMSHSAAAVAVKDMAGRYEYVNPRFAELFQISQEQVVGRTDRQLFDESLAALLIEQDFKAVRANGVVEGYEEVPVPAGARRFFCIHFPLKGDDGVNYATCTKLIECNVLDHECSC